MLGGGLSSRLFQEIRERRGLAYSVWSERVAYHDAGFLSVGLGTAPEHVPEVLRIVTDELAALGADGVTDRELAIAKGNLRAETLLACEDSGARMSRIGAGMLLHGEVLTVDAVLARVEAVTREDVHTAATTLAAAPRTLSVVGTLRRRGVRHRRPVARVGTAGSGPVDDGGVGSDGRRRCPGPGRGRIAPRGDVAPWLGLPPCESGWWVPVVGWGARCAAPCWAVPASSWWPPSIPATPASTWGS